MSLSPKKIITTVNPHRATSTAAMGETLFALHPPPTTTQHDLAPFSAVSSFNLPAQCDSSLMTPVSLTGSPSLAIESHALNKSKRDARFSPSTVSPYHLFAEEEDFGSKLPMKWKDPKATHIPTSESPFNSPYPIPEPYFGSYSVSATSGYGRAPDASPSMQHSPKVSPNAGLGHGSYQSHRTTQTSTSSASFRSIQAPILIAPNPSTLRPATRQDDGPYRQNSLHSIHSNPSTLSSYGYSDDRSSQSPPRGKKRKSPSVSTGLDDYINYPDDINDEDRLLLDLAAQRELPWKKKTAKFNEKTGKQLKDAALQMRKKRLLDRMKPDNATHDDGSAQWEHRGNDRAPHSNWLDSSVGPSPSHNSLSPNSNARSMSRNPSIWSDRGSTASTTHDTESWRLVSALTNANFEDSRRPSGVGQGNASFRPQQSYEQRSPHFTNQLRSPSQILLMSGSHNQQNRQW